MEGHCVQVLVCQFHDNRMTALSAPAFCSGQLHALNARVFFARGDQCLGPARLLQLLLRGTTICGSAAKGFLHVSKFPCTLLPLDLGPEYWSYVVGLFLC